MLARPGEKGLIRLADRHSDSGHETRANRSCNMVVPNIVRRYRRTRGKQRAPTKTQITLRLDSDLVLHFRETGKGWQTRMNDTLREAVFKDE